MVVNGPDVLDEHVDQGVPGCARDEGVADDRVGLVLGVWLKAAKKASVFASIQHVLEIFV